MKWQRKVSRFLSEFAFSSVHELEIGSIRAKFIQADDVVWQILAFFTRDRRIASIPNLTSVYCLSIITMKTKHDIDQLSWYVLDTTVNKLKGVTILFTLASDPNFFTWCSWKFTVYHLWQKHANRAEWCTPAVYLFKIFSWKWQNSELQISGFDLYCFSSWSRYKGICSAIFALLGVLSEQLYKELCPFTMFFSFTASICNVIAQRKSLNEKIFHVDSSTSQLLIWPKHVSINAEECLANKQDVFDAAR